MRKKNSILILLVVLLCLFCVNTNTKATEFNEGNESYYNGICNGYISADSANRKVCEEYKQYLVNKKNTAQQRLEQLKAEVAASASKLEAIEAKSKEISARMENIHANIAAAENDLMKITEGLELVEKSIVEKTEAAQKRKQMILDRIPQLAIKANTNQYIDFIMGATSLVDLIQRSTSIDTFTKYDKDMIETYQKELEILKEEEKEQVRLKEQMEVYKAELELQEQELQTAYELNQVLANAYHEQYEEDMTKKTEAERLVQVANAAANKIVFTGSITSSGYMSDPIPGVYHSANTWAYPGGGLHRGLDKAAPIGTPIYAPANGIVLSARTGVNSSGGGYLGNMSGYPAGGGNTLHILVEANGQVYGVTFAHMSQMIISDKTQIVQGQLIGYTGNTGNSTGPHCHIEVFKLNMSFQQALNYWNTYFDWAWGCSWNYGPSCSSAGCRIRPESLGW